jgi:hypothetical protein
MGINLTALPEHSYPPFTGLNDRLELLFKTTAGFNKIRRDFHGFL